jgi:protein translocase SEC61 complex gamma subunit
MSRQSRNNDKDGYRHYFNLSNYLRVVRIAKEPDREEFSKVSKIVTLSVFGAGLLGYIIFFVMGLLPL